MLNNNLNTERCLVWILALVRGVITNKAGTSVSTATSVSQHILQDIYSSLQVLGTQPSKQGLLASLLANQINGYLINNSFPHGHDPAQDEDEEFI